MLAFTAQYANIHTLQYSSNTLKVVNFMLNLAQAQTALAAHASNASITAQQIVQLLANKSTTFAQIVYCTQVAVAAKHKHTVNIIKVTSANVQLFANINAATSVYTNAVQRSAAKIASNDPASVAQFTAQSNYFTHTNCYSIVQHNSNSKLYLYAIYNNASRLYFVNNVLATKQQVAAYLTASAAAQLLNASSVTHNATHNIAHSVTVRTIALQNIVSITANKTQVTVAN